MYVLAIDPGLTTGVALVTPEGELEESKLLYSPKEVVEYIDDFWESPTPVRVVVEDFVGAGPRTTEAIFVLKLIGGVEATCVLNGLPLVVQAPQVRIPLHSDAERRAPKGTSKHVIDAYAHALAYLERVHGVCIHSD